MPVYLCRWSNGDCSFVSAPNRDIAIELLDEVADAEGCPLAVVRDFMAHFKLEDNGEIVLEDFGERTYEAIWKHAYPILYKASSEAETDTFNENQTDAIRAAVENERKRVRYRRVEAQTAHGKHVQKISGAPARMVDRMIREHATKVLERMPKRGKPQ